VEFSSAQQSAGDNCYKVEDANHMEVCKPPSKEHSSYGLLLQFINEVRFNDLVISIFHKHESISFFMKYSKPILDNLNNCGCENMLSHATCRFSTFCNEA